MLVMQVYHTVYVPRKEIIMAILSFCSTEDKKTIMLPWRPYRSKVKTRSLISIISHHYQHSGLPNSSSSIPLSSLTRHGLTRTR